MERKTLYAAAALALSALSAPISGAAQMASTPVRVDACGADKGRPALQFVNVFNQQVSQAAVSPMLMIDFANASSHSIAGVDFGVVSNGKLLATVRDNGAFPPGARVMHAYGINQTAVPANPMSVSCVPLRIQYTDGTTWMNPSMPAH